MIRSSVLMKCKKKNSLKVAYFIEKTNKKNLHFRMLTLQNVKFEMSEYSNTTIKSIPYLNILLRQNSKFSSIFIKQNL